MPRFLSVILFGASILVFLSGVFPLSYAGIMLPIFFFILMGSGMSSAQHAAWGVLGAIFIDSYGAAPFGTHALLFLILTFLLSLIKRVLATHYFWGDLITIVGLTALGEVFLSLFSLFMGEDIITALSLSYLSKRLFLFLVLGILAALMLARWYKTETIEAKPYVI